MYTLNNKRNCSIFNGTLFQDLEDYSLIYNENDPDDHALYIQQGQSQSAILIDQYNELSSLILSDNLWTTGVWLPVILDQNYSQTEGIEGTRVFDKQTVDNSKILGISNFLSFDAYFKNWRVHHNNIDSHGTMVTDWNITSPVPSFEAQYGLLFWYKIDNPNPVYRLYQMPNGSIIKSYTEIKFADGSTLPANLTVVKLSNSRLKRSDKRSSVITSGSFSFWQEPEIFDLDSSNFDINTNLFFYADDQEKKMTLGTGENYSLWVSDGEVFSYFDSPTDRLRNRARSLCSKTYLSPILMPIYREVKNKLLINWSKSTTTRLDKKKARLLQKLSYYLSTFPLIDRVSIDISFNDDLTEYLNSSISDNQSEVIALKKILMNISNKYSYQSLTDQTHNKNYIRNEKKLAEKILSKYGASLLIKSEEFLEYKHPIKNGAHALIGIDSYMKIINPTDSNSIYYNNCSISLGNLNYITEISSTKSLIHLSGTDTGSSSEIPLVDIAVKRDSPTTFTLGTDRYISFTSPETTLIDLNPNGEVYNTTYYWELLSGPECFRFSDFNRDKFWVSRFVTSTDSNPRAYIRQSGTYEIKCTKISNGLVDSDTFLITTDPTVPLINPNISSITNPVYPKIINGVPKKIGFNKYGMIWISDTENYITDTYTYKPTSDFGILDTYRLKDIKIDLTQSQPLSRVSNNANLSIQLTPGINTQIIINGINIENARSDNFEHCQCESFYNEKIYRDPVNPLAPVLGTANFARDIEQQYSFVYYNNTGPLIPHRSSILTAPSIISTELAPPILAYGGYSTDKVNNIGVLMPGHPTGTGLPKLDKRNDIVTPDPTGLHCFLKEVGYGSPLSFKKGFFDPTIGWISSTSGTSYENKSCVISDSLSKQKSYIFKGQGFFSLKSSSTNTNTYKSIIEIYQNSYLTAFDQYDIRYGYRNFNDDQKLDHKFSVETNKNSWFYDNSCGENKVSYAIPVSGIIGQRKIQDLEIKLNYLNYPDPENLVIWLDVLNISGTNTSNPSYLYSTAASNDLNSSINNMNNGNRLYLHNQEHISNYQTNFSITFSDSASKANSCNRNTYEFNGNNNFNDPINNNSKIQPSLMPTGSYNNIGITAIKTNSFNNINNYFAKFKGVNLNSNIKFILNISVIEPFEYTNRILDDLLINNIFKLNSDNVDSSSSINNSLCSWDLILHTDDVSRYSDNDILGKINYFDCINSSASGENLIDGYNFICNFSGIEYFIPQVNLNAPYGYITNINSCLYDQEGVGDTWSFTRPSYNENIRAINLGIMQYLVASSSAMAGAAFGAVGGIMGLYALQAVYEQGGRSDPLINFFIETGLLDQTEAQDAQYYKPIYSKKFFGRPDRALLAISKDGNYWYNVDVPVFKLNNTPILTKNKYKYIKLSDNVIPGISTFTYKTISNYSDLDLSPVVKTFTENIQLSGLLSGNINSKGSTVLVTGQTSNDDNGYYIVDNETWIKLPSLSSVYFLRNNSIAPSLTAQSLSSKTNILIDGRRAYNFFDKNETVTLSNGLGSSNLNIIDKSYIQTSTGVKTILTLSSAVVSDGTIYKDKNNANVILLYKSNLANIDLNTENTWMLEKTRSEKSENIDPIIYGSSYGEGSIGYGTDILDPDVLRKLTFSYNEISETNKLLNNHENDIYKFNSIFIKNISGTQTIEFDISDSQQNLLKGYSYRPQEFISKPLFQNYEDLLLENAMLRNSVINKEFSNHYFMEIKSDKFKSTGVLVDSGDLYIENDYKRIYPVNFPSGDIEKMEKRTEYLLASGIPLQYSIYQTVNEPISCYTDYNRDSCPKTKAYQDFLILDREKNQLLEALSLPKSSGSSEFCTNGSIRYSGDFDPTTTQIDVIYNTNNSVYWINIDPEQACSLNDEFSAKVLESIEMKGIPISSVEAEGIVPGQDSHIVPKTSSNGIVSGIDLSMEKTGLTYKYIIPQSKIQEDKNLWSGVNWIAPEKFSYGAIDSAGDSKKIQINRLNSYKDMLVYIKENYVRPSGMSSIGVKKVKDIVNLNSQENLYVRFRNIPRKIKGIDSENFERYIYDRNGNLIRSSRPPSSVGKVANNFTCWHCIDGLGKYLTNLPPYYQIANEMRYRAFYGSIDGIENKNSLYTDSKNDWEWIPYEFYRS